MNFESNIHNCDLLVIGDGISARTFLNKLHQKKLTSHLKIIQVFQNELAPACSYDSTSFVSLHGIEEGVSELGDLLRSGYFAFKKDFDDAKNVEGVVKGYHYVSGDLSLIEKRFGKEQIQELQIPQTKSLIGVKLDSYFVSPIPYLNGLLTYQNVITRYSDFVVEIRLEDSLVITQRGQKIYYKKLLVCTGAYTKIFEKIFPSHKSIEHSKVAHGTYWSIPHIDMGETSFTLTLDKSNLIYRSLEKRILIGGTTQSTSMCTPDHTEILKMYQKFLDYVELPSFNLGKSFVGLRHKGQKRLPFYGEISQNIYGMFATYKNGISLPSFISEELIRDYFNL